MGQKTPHHQQQPNKNLEWRNISGKEKERKRVSGQSGSIQGEIDLQVMEQALLRFASSL